MNIFFTTDFKEKNTEDYYLQIRVFPVFSVKPVVKTDLK
jgi:hypothetical protein